ncbi:acetate/propionate family kinase [Candidatus Kaiserbacteria bacterium]|nr:acetate/propionate family kinase [Candidatus Kaiserbacteria bacterium]
MATTLVVNPGSSSRKYALYCDGNLVLDLRFEDTQAGFEMCTRFSGGQQICEPIKESQFSDAQALVADEVDKYLFRESAGSLGSVIVRVVAPGTYFQNHRVIDDEFIKKLQASGVSAPLHIPTILREIAGLKKHFKLAKLLAASDSAFHKTMPNKARCYSIDAVDARAHDLYRFGYHGLSVASIVRRVHSVIGQDPERMIVCHIGSGASVTAVKAGRSVETTMGFSPTSGLPMSSRAGDLDAAALLELMRFKNLRLDDAEMYLNTRGGLAGLANEPDIRRLLDRRAQYDSTAKQALEKFAYSIQQAIAASTVSLGGLDVLVLTATAAVRSAELRHLILAELSHLGIVVSPDRNNALVGSDGVVSVRNSQVKVVVMRTDEMGEMANIAYSLAGVE